MNDNFRNEIGKEILEDFNSHVELGPIMTEFEDVEHIAFEINFAVEIRVVEDLFPRPHDVSRCLNHMQRDITCLDRDLISTIVFTS